MEKLIAHGCKQQFVPESYILPPEKRPGISTCQAIPVVDLGRVDGQDRKNIVLEILKASEEFGFFQVINHGVMENTMKDMMDVATEFFEMPVEDRASLYVDDPDQIVRFYTSIDYDKEDVHYWRDTLRHPCHPVEEFKHLLPKKPTRYSDMAGTYSVEVRKLGLTILELISEGLGLEIGYFEDELSKSQILSVNHYPPCPDPSLTLGLPKHGDPNILTLLLQGSVSGLQVSKYGEWISVEPIPNAFVINLGHQLQIISNGRLKSVEHRVVTNSSTPRTTVATFICPPMNGNIEPAKQLINESNPAIYRSVQYQEFLSKYVTAVDDTEEGYKHQFVPESYILPPEKRPGISTCQAIPVVNLGGIDGLDRKKIVLEILKACEEFGFFQVINHGVTENMMKDMMDVATEFFEMPVEDRASMYNNDGIIKLYTSIDYEKENVHYWRDNLKHPCHPFEDYKHLLPRKPTRYREVAGTYSVEMRKLGLKILELISEGLGLNNGYFEDELSKDQILSVNHYPPCPDPSLTLGLPKHGDPNILTLLLQGSVSGLQVSKNGEWISVEPIPNAFVINLGHQLQIISNGRLKSVEHRVVTNSSTPRTTVATFICPPMNGNIEPAKQLINESNPAIYRSFQYQEFVSKYMTAGMEKLIAQGYTHQFVPESYILPPEKRPGISTCQAIPVVNLGVDGHDRNKIVLEIFKASEDFGFFQVINHGVTENTMKDMMDVAREFFEMPVEDRASLYTSNDSKQVVKLYSSIDYDKEDFHYWRDNFKHPCHPVEEYKHLLPTKPSRYREVAGAYAVEVRKLGLKILELIGEGLGLNNGYFKDELSESQILSVNHYPTCPDPSLTLGLPKHGDPNVLTLLFQGAVSGLQVSKNGEWISVEPVPNAFVINLGHQLQIVSNGRFKSVEHRVVTNANIARTTVATFISPSMNGIVEPAKQLINESSPAIYRSVQYQEFFSKYMTAVDDTEEVFKPFKLSVN